MSRRNRQGASLGFRFTAIAQDAYDLLGLTPDLLAYCDLAFRASYSTKEIPDGRTIRKGEVLMPERLAAERWGLSKKGARGVLARLCRLGLIERMDEKPDSLRRACRYRVTHLAGTFKSQAPGASEAQAEPPRNHPQRHRPGGPSGTTAEPHRNHRGTTAEPRIVQNGTARIGRQSGPAAHAEPPRNHAGHDPGKAGHGPGAAGTDTQLVDQSRSRPEREVPPAPAVEADPPGFAEFWSAHPRALDRDRPGALREWHALDPDPELQRRIVEAMRDQAQQEPPRAHCIPRPSTWLRHHRWEPEQPAPHAGWTESPEAAQVETGAH